VRIRIALATAVAVIVVAVPAVLMSFFNGGPAWARAVRHQAISIHRTTKVHPRVMSLAQARQVAQLVNFANAVSLAQQETYLKDAAFLETVEKQNFYNAIVQQQARAAAARAQAVAAATPRPAAATPLPAAAANGSDATSTNTADWACIRAHESGGNYAEGGGGAYQFEFGTWHGLTGLPSPAQDYPAPTQDAAALKLFSQRGWEPWTTRTVCGL
jgi:hypothetical protein